MFLVLPVGFLSRIISIAYPAVSPVQCGSYNCLVPLYHQTVGRIAAFWAIAAGIIGTLIGAIVLLFGPRPRVGIALGLAFSLGSMTILYWTATTQILRSLVVTPSLFLLFPESSVIAMAGATALYSYELARRGREVIDAITS